MFTNLLIITVLIIAFWMAATAFYLYTSRQQESLEKEIEAVQKLLDKSKP
jgi:preprotein translocase subunit YajC